MSNTDADIKENIPYILAASKSALHERILGLQMQLADQLPKANTKDTPYVSSVSLMGVTYETAFFKALADGDYRTALITKKQWQDAMVEESAMDEGNGVIVATRKDKDGSIQSMECRKDSNVAMRFGDLMRYKFEEFEGRLRACRLQMISDEFNTPEFDSPRYTAMQKYRDEARAQGRRSIDFTFAGYEIVNTCNGFGIDMELAIDLKRSVLGQKGMMMWVIHMRQHNNLLIDNERKLMIITDGTRQEYEERVAANAVSPTFEELGFQPPEDAKKGQ